MKNVSLKSLKTLKPVHLRIAALVLILFVILISLFSCGKDDEKEVSNENSSVSLPAQSENISSNKENFSEDEENPKENSSSSAVNYYVRLNRGLSSDNNKLVLTSPSQLKTSVDYRGKNFSSTISDEKQISQIISLLQNAKKIPDDSTIVSTSSARSVSLTLPYSDGFGNLYVFEAFLDSSNKTVTIIQDNLSNLYEAKNSVASSIFDLVKPKETSLNAERLNIYSSKNFEKNILKAQSKNSEDFEMILNLVNSLDYFGSSLDLDSPDYLITLLPPNSVQEDNFCYLWLDEKYVKIAFAEDDIAVYSSNQVTSSQIKKWIKNNSVK